MDVFLRERTTRGLFLSHSEVHQHVDVHSSTAGTPLPSNKNGFSTQIRYASDDDQSIIKSQCINLIVLFQQF